MEFSRFSRQCVINRLNTLYHEKLILSSILHSFVCHLYIYGTIICVTILENCKEASAVSFKMKHLSVANLASCVIIKKKDGGKKDSYERLC